ncbi:MAG TPA: YfiR family protein [Gammaproteobacteria bacterium]|nr:YfiR family protein [Gammaproteobacteria bacterium]
MMSVFRLFRGRSGRVPWWHRLLLLLLLSPVFGQAEVPSTEENALKAALVYKLAQFVEWPDSAASSPVFAFCLLGEDAFDGALDRLQGRILDERPVEVRHYSQSETVPADCRVLYLVPDKQPFERDILSAYALRPMLTLGETESFAENGGMIQLRRQGRKFGFVITPKSARRAGLSITAPLLSMATIVDTRPEDTP